MPEKSCKSFKSKGTIRVKIGPKECGQWQRKIFFKPDSKYSTPRSGCKHYAHFLPTGEDEDCALSIKYHSDEGVSITVPDKFPSLYLPGLVEAAVKQTLVEVKVVKRNKKKGWKLRAISIPAPGKSK